MIEVQLPEYLFLVNLITSLIRTKQYYQLMENYYFLHQYPMNCYDFLEMRIDSYLYYQNLIVDDQKLN